jgi:integrase
MIEKRKRRPKGNGSVYRQGRIWWIAYRAPDGSRQAESTGSVRKTDAERLLRTRVGAREHNLPVIPRAEQLAFGDAAMAMIHDFEANGKRSLAVVERRIRKHLQPYFVGRRLIGITTADVTAYVAKRQRDTIVTRQARCIKRTDGTSEEVPEVRRSVSNAEINRELQILKRIFSLAIESGRIATKPTIRMLREAPARAGFFEPEQYTSVLAKLPEELRPIITFAYITGWRIPSEVLPLQWRQVDFAAGEVRLDAGTTKNGEGRVFPMSAELRTLLQGQRAEHERLQKAGQLEPWVFFRMVAKGRGGPRESRPILAFNKAWNAACRLAGCPGRIPHDLRRTSVRNLVRVGIPERVAMQMTGHKTRSVFERYNITSPGDLRDAARRLDAALGGR